MDINLFRNSSTNEKRIYGHKLIPIVQQNAFAIFRKRQKNM